MLSKAYIQDFHDALTNLDITYFYKLRNRDLLSLIENNFKINSRINRAYLTNAFNDLFEKDVSIDSIIDQLQKINKEDIIEIDKIKHSGSKHYIYPRRKDSRYY